MPGLVRPARPALCLTQAIEAHFVTNDEVPPI